MCDAIWFNHRNSKFVKVETIVDYQTDGKEFKEMLVVMTRELTETLAAETIQIRFYKGETTQRIKPDFVICLVPVYDVGGFDIFLYTKFVGPTSFKQSELIGRYELQMTGTEKQKNIGFV